MRSLYSVGFPTYFNFIYLCESMPQYTKRDKTRREKKIKFKKKTGVICGCELVVAIFCGCDMHVNCFNTFIG